LQESGHKRGKDVGLALIEMSSLSIGHAFQSLARRSQQRLENGTDD
jgi:hypothetical protein